MLLGVDLGGLEGLGWGLGRRWGTVGDGGGTVGRHRKQVYRVYRVSKCMCFRKYLGCLSACAFVNGKGA